MISEDDFKRLTELMKDKQRLVERIEGFEKDHLTMGLYDSLFLESSCSRVIRPSKESEWFNKTFAAAVEEANRKIIKVLKSELSLIEIEISRYIA